MREARDEVTRHFPSRQEPVLNALTGALLAGNETATVLLGQRNLRQVEAASKAGEALTETEAQWVRKIYRGE